MFPSRVDVCSCCLFFLLSRQLSEAVSSCTTSVARIKHAPHTTLATYRSSLRINQAMGAHSSNGSLRTVARTLVYPQHGHVPLVWTIRNSTSFITSRLRPMSLLHIHPILDAASGSSWNLIHSSFIPAQCECRMIFSRDYGFNRTHPG
jgi:hypothetical protein